MAISDYNPSASLNTSISGINIGEGSPAANVNDAIRRLMADLAQWTADVAIESQFSDLSMRVRQIIAPTGRLWSLEFPDAFYGETRSDLSRLTFARASSGDAIGGASEAAFAADVPRVHDGRWFLDAGGTNAVTVPEDITDASWTKTGLNNGGATNVAGEAGATSAKRIPETNTGVAQNHRINGSFSFLSASSVVAEAIVDGDGRDFIQMLCYNAATTGGVMAIFDLTDGSLVSPYPATLGAPGIAANPRAGIRQLPSGLWQVWVSSTFAAATTGCVIYIVLQSDAATESYIGDVTKALIVERTWAIPGRTSPVSYVETTRATELATTPTLPVPFGGHASLIIDELGQTLTTFVGDSWEITPQPDAYEILSASTYLLNIYDDFNRANTADGSLGTAQDGGVYSLLQYPGSYPMVSSMEGRIEGGQVRADAGVTYYAVRAVPAGQKVRHMRGTIRWYGPQAGTGTLTNSTAALVGCDDSLDELIATLPVHPAITRSGVSLTKRIDGGAFEPLGQIVISQALSEADHAAHDVSWNLHGDVLTFTFNGITLCLQDAEIESRMGRYGFFEKQETSPNTTDEVRWTGFGMEAFPIGEPGDPTPAVPVNHAAPFAVGATVVGTTFSMASFLGTWSSNAGEITFEYKWQKNGVDIGGQTTASLNTSAGYVATDVIRGAVRATNDDGASDWVFTPNVTLT